MKKIFLAFAVFTTLCTVSCSKMNDLHQQYLDQGEKIYVGSVDSLEAWSGVGRVELRWRMTADPRATKLTISWNNGVDKIELPVDRSNNTGYFRDSHMFTDMAEQSYTFVLQTSDNSGNKSVMREVTTTVYGADLAETYSLTLPRKITTIELNDATSGNVVLAEVDDETMQTSYLTYSIYPDGYDMPGKEVRVEIPNDINSYPIEQIKLGDQVSISSLYLPEKTALDGFVGKTQTASIPKQIMPKLGNWVTIQGTDINYGWTVATTGVTYELFSNGNFNQFKIAMGVDPIEKWCVGFDINEDNSITCYEVFANNWPNREFGYTPEMSWWDPLNGVIHLRYRMKAPGAWEQNNTIVMKKKE